MHPTAPGAQPETGPPLEKDTTKYWSHFGAGFGIAIIFGIFSLFGLFVVKGERKRKYYIIGCAVGIGFSIVLWMILYFAVFAVAATSISSVDYSPGYID